MRNKTMRITTDVYEYETRSLTPQECVPTIKIAYHDVTMQDMFERPKYVAELKQLQDVIDNVKDQIVTLHREGLTPTAVIVDRKTEYLMLTAPNNGLYTPVGMTADKRADTFMGLDIAINPSQRDVQYIRVVV